MASIEKCKECEKDISSTAENCPHCGYKNQKFNLVLWMSGTMFLIFVGIPYLISATSKNIPSSAKTTFSNNINESQCGLINGYQIGMSIRSFKETYPKNLTAPSCRTISPKMVRCDGQMEINNVKTFVSIDFGYGNDNKDGTQFIFGNGKLFGVMGSFEKTEFDTIRQEFTNKFGVPKTNNKDSNGNEGMLWNKDGNEINLSQIPDGEGYLFSIIPSEPKRLSACLSSH